MILVIGIAGKKRSGKDTVAQMLMDCALVSDVKATRRALADELKDECAAMIARELGSNEAYYVALHEMYEDATKEKYRLLLQWWGTEFKRGLDDDYWVNKLQGWIERNAETDQVVVVPDVRFPNEVAMIKKLNGVMINVHRPSLVASDPHPSETMLDDYAEWNFVVNNDSDLEALRQTVQGIYVTLADWAWGRPL